MQGKIEVQWVLKKDLQIIAFDKYNLLSPELSDSSTFKPDFIDQKRFTAPNGHYVLELAISDKNSAEHGVSIKQPFEVKFDTNNVIISDIELIESYKKSETPDKFSKSGYDLIPFASNFYHEGINSISFYAEVYNTKKVLGDNDFLVTYSIWNDASKGRIDDFVFTKKQKPQDVCILLATLPLDKISSGNYDIVVEVRNDHNQLLANKHVFFQRSSPSKQPIVGNDDFSQINTSGTFVADYTNADSLRTYIDCLYPISSPVERNIEDNQIDAKDVKLMQQFMYYFWSKKDADNPEQKWIDYKAEVEKANAAFGTHNKKGYETDRGRVFLEYGEPNSIDHNDMSGNTYPYEIWHYFTVGKQTNRKFVFYSHDRSSNNYVLLHSDAIGEISNYDWNRQLHGKTISPTGNIDETGITPAFGDHTQDSYDMPK